MIWNSQKEKLSNKVLEARGNMKQLYNLVSNLTSTQHLNLLPEDTPSEELADRFVNYFIEKSEPYNTPQWTIQHTMQHQHLQAVL